MHWHTTAQVETQLLKLIFSTRLPQASSVHAYKAVNAHLPKLCCVVLLRRFVTFSLKSWCFWHWKITLKNNSAIHFRVVFAGYYLKKNTESEPNISLITCNYFFSLQWHFGVSLSTSFEKERSHPCKVGRISTQSALNLPQSRGSAAQRPFSLFEGSLHHVSRPTSINKGEVLGT